MYSFIINLDLFENLEVLSITSITDMDCIVCGIDLYYNISQIKKLLIRLFVFAVLKLVRAMKNVKSI